VFNGGIEPNPVISVFDRFQYQNNSRFLLKIGIRRQAPGIRLKPKVKGKRPKEKGISYSECGFCNAKFKILKAEKRKENNNVGGCLSLIIA